MLKAIPCLTLLVFLELGESLSLNKAVANTHSSFWPFSSDNDKEQKKEDEDEDDYDDPDAKPRLAADQVDHTLGDSAYPAIKKNRNTGILGSEQEGGNSGCHCDFPCWINDDGSACFTTCCKKEDAGLLKGVIGGGQDSKQAVAEEKVVVATPASEADAALSKAVEADAPVAKTDSGPVEAVSAESCQCDFPCWLKNDGSTCFNHCCPSSR